MAKRRKRRSALPPEGLWVSSDGEAVPVVEHLLALQSHPEQFGLPESTRRAGIPELRNLAEGLIRQGWVRFRYLAGTYAFEVDNARRRMKTVTNILKDADAFSGETVAISQVLPLREFQGTVGDVYDRSVLVMQENPVRNRWRFTQRRR
ncbi:MAG: hypothetical protein ABSE73_01445 [Planctomycetota bacterium]